MRNIHQTKGKRGSAATNRSKREKKAFRQLKLNKGYPESDS